MDAHLKTLADASLEVEAAEQALADEATHTAIAHLDAADEQLAALRSAWPSMSAPQRAVVGRPAAGVKARMDAARAKLPKATALTVGTPVHDPDEESEPGD